MIEWTMGPVSPWARWFAAAWTVAWLAYATRTAWRLWREWRWFRGVALAKAASERHLRYLAEFVDAFEGLPMEERGRARAAMLATIAARDRQRLKEDRLFADIQRHARRKDSGSSGGDQEHPSGGDPGKTGVEDH